MDIQSKKSEFEKIISFTQQEIESLRTNRISPAMIENIKVDVYGAKMPVMQVASINSPEPRQLLIEPWDKSIIKEIEKAIETSALGFSVANEGNFLRLNMPSLTEETRKKVLKILNEKIEKNRITVRGLRDKIKEEITAAEKQKEISEDERYRFVEELDKMTRESTDKINALGEKKEKEIML